MQVSTGRVLYWAAPTAFATSEFRPSAPITAAFLFGYMLALAYLAAFVTYHTAVAFGAG
jgi:hypothetical protein